MSSPAGNPQGWSRAIFLAVLAIVPLRAATNAPPAGSSTLPFFAMHTATRDAAHASAEAQVGLVKSFGYDGIGAVPPTEIAAMAAACDRYGSRLWNTYLVVDIDPTSPPDPELAAQLAPLRGRDALLWVGLTSRQHAPSAPAGDPAGARRVVELADLARSVGARVALYPHAGFWLERTEDAVRVANLVNRPDVGVTFNLCHFLKVEDEARLEEVVRVAKSRLFVVSLNGAERERKGGDWKELIQTLDRGSFDNTRLLRALRDVGYAGPVGFQGYGIGGETEDNLRRTMQAWRELNRRTAATPASDERLAFRPDGRGGFTFDTGRLKGRLHADGRSLGLTEVYHVATGARLDGSNGLLSHYRVFANGRRFGGGAWDWPSTGTQLPDGGVEIQWPAAADRPLAMRAVYRLAQPGIVTVETVVEPKAGLRGLEVFLASYFSPAFTNATIAVRGKGTATLTEATPDKGDWQMYVRDPAARALASDGRWTLEPHPVAWSFPAELAGPVVRAQREAPALGLCALLNADTNECFAVATPHQTEGHFSTYLSLFGRSPAAGENLRARATLELTDTSSR